MQKNKIFQFKNYLFIIYLYFLTAEHMVNRHRASLALETVDMLVFLNHNWDL